MSGLDIKISGVDLLVKKLDSRNLGKGAMKALNVFGLKTQTDAKNIYAPTDEGLLKSKIYNTNATPDNLSVTLGCTVNYAAYMEFGTGPYAAAQVATMPKEWQDYAMKFYVNGEGHTPAHPFMYPAINFNLKQLKEDLKLLLND